MELHLLATILSGEIGVKLVFETVCCVLSFYLVRSLFELDGVWAGHDLKTL